MNSPSINRGRVECGWCGAPLSLPAGAVGTVRCTYCRSDVVVRAPRAPVAGAPAPVHVAERQGEGSVLFARLRRFVPLVLATLLGWLLPMAVVLAVRPMALYPPAVLGAIGACVLALLAARRRVLPLAIAGAVGLLYALKPFVIGLPRGLSATSETGLTYLLPGVALLALAALIALASTKESVRADLAASRLRPGALVWLVPGLVVAGLSLRHYGGDTARVVQQRHGARLAALNARMRSIAAALEANPAGLPTSACGLAPPLELRRSERSTIGSVGNAEVLSVPQLRDITSRETDELYLHGSLYYVLSAAAPRSVAAYLDEPAPEYEREFLASLATPYLVVYRPKAGAPRGTLEAWLADLRTGALLLALPPLTCPDGGLSECAQPFVDAVNAAAR